MQWKGRRESENIEDRRSLATTGLAIGGAGGILALIVALLLGVDPRQLMGPGNQQPAAVNDPEEEEQKKFVAVVLADTEDVWHEQFKKLGKEYRKPTLVLFRGKVESACGLASSAVGPFYCPGDEKVYLDLQFFKELSDRLKVQGEFARAYVIAHEVGHHVQNQLGDMQRVHSFQERVARAAEKNQASVRLELQADFLAGVWAHHAQKTKRILEAGDLESALNAAFTIGDDALQQKAQGYVRPDSFTHGTSEQRMRWFKRGFANGDLAERDLLFTRNYNEL